MVLARTLREQIPLCSEVYKVTSDGEVVMNASTNWMSNSLSTPLGRRLIVGDGFLSLRSLNRDFAFSEVAHDRLLIFLYFVMIDRFCL